MRNIIASFLTGRICRWLIIGLTAVAFVGLFMAKSGAHEAHPYPGGTQVGQAYMVSAVCNARGASKVAAADLEADNHEAGNAMFRNLASTDRDEADCWAIGFPVPMLITEMFYVGASAGDLHVYVVKFGEDMYSVATHRMEPVGNETYGYDYKRDSV